ncbi:hypothetical protein PR202_ga12510 [Eleusine coracana subsp. coracana]|uniref:Uncharacterized protein n=1 Tax=Eleusine coracana subsp. coracana TaxID=191504 RepID=A0AAV5CBT2_ELECO|nr:hypothetical protein PR202_ga12510 [Eleusine coracana subsp. coracana]
MDDALHIDDVLNSGVTHDFIDVTVANNMRLQLHCALLALTLTSRDRVMRRIICPKLPIVINCDNFFDTPRLASLGPVMMDFIALCMSFFIDGQRLSILVVIAIKGCPRRVTNILSILHDDKDLYDTLRDVVITDLELSFLVARISSGDIAPAWSFRDGLIFFDGHLYIAAFLARLHRLLSALLKHGEEALLRQVTFTVPNGAVAPLSAADFGILFHHFIDLTTAHPRPHDTFIVTFEGFLLPSPWLFSDTDLLSLATAGDVSNLSYVISFDVNDTCQSFIVIFIFDWSITVELHQPPSVFLPISGHERETPSTRTCWFSTQVEVLWAKGLRPASYQMGRLDSE